MDLVEQKTLAVEIIKQSMEAIEGVTDLGDGLYAAPYEPQTDHYYAHGSYARVMKMHKNTMIVGAKHKYEQINIVAKGRARVVNVADDKIVGEYEAGDVFIAPAGSQRAICALEELVWVNCFATDKRGDDFINEFIEVE
jgi:hypothetical protein